MACGGDVAYRPSEWRSRTMLAGGFRRKEDTRDQHDVPVAGPRLPDRWRRRAVPRPRIQPEGQTADGAGRPGHPAGTAAGVTDLAARRHHTGPSAPAERPRPAFRRHAPGEDPA